MARRPRRPRRRTEHAGPEEAQTPSGPVEIDLHGMPPEQALRRLSQGLHGCRQRRLPEALVITGQGRNNSTGRPVLRTRVEEWLAGDGGRRLGVRGFERDRHGGALLVQLGRAT